MERLRRRLSHMDSSASSVSSTAVVNPTTTTTTTTTTTDAATAEAGPVATSTTSATSTPRQKRKSRHVRFGGDIEVHAIERKRASMVATMFYTARDILQFKEEKVEEEAAALQEERDRQKLLKKQEKEEKKKLRKAKLAERKAKRTASTGKSDESDAIQTDLDLSTTAPPTNVEIEEPLHSALDGSESSLPGNNSKMDDVSYQFDLSEQDRSPPPQQQQMCDLVHDSITVERNRRFSSFALQQQPQQQYDHSPKTFASSGGYLPSQYLMEEEDQDEHEEYQPYDNQEAPTTPQEDNSPDVNSRPEEASEHVTDDKQNDILQNPLQDSSTHAPDNVDDFSMKDASEAQQRQDEADGSSPSTAAICPTPIIMEDHPMDSELPTEAVEVSTGVEEHDTSQSVVVDNQIMEPNPTNPLDENNNPATMPPSTDKSPSAIQNSPNLDSPQAPPSLGMVPESTDSPNFPSATLPSLPLQVTSSPLDTPVSCQDPIEQSLELPVSPTSTSAASSPNPLQSTDEQQQYSTPPSPPVIYHHVMNNSSAMAPPQELPMPPLLPLPPRSNEVKRSVSLWSFKSWTSRDNRKTPNEEREGRKTEKTSRKRDGHGHEHEERHHRHDRKHESHDEDHHDPPPSQQHRPLASRLAGSNAIPELNPSPPKKANSKSFSGVRKVFTKLKRTVSSSKKHKERKSRARDEDVDAYDWSQNFESERQQKARQPSRGQKSSSNNKSGQAYDWEHHHHQQKSPNYYRGPLTSVPELPSMELLHTNADREDEEEKQEGEFAASTDLPMSSELVMSDNDDSGERNETVRSRRPSSMVRLMNKFMALQKEKGQNSQNESHDNDSSPLGAQIDQDERHGRERKALSSGDGKSPGRGATMASQQISDDDPSYAWEHHAEIKKAPIRRTSSFLGRLLESKTQRRARKRSKEEEDTRTRRREDRHRKQAT